MNDRTLVGAILIALGIVLLLSNLGMGVRFRVSSLWPLLVALIGVMFIRDALQPYGDRSQVFVGTIILGVGILYFFREIGLIKTGMRQIWPAFVIVVGLAFFAQAAAMHESHYSATGAMLCAVGVVFLVATLRLVDSKLVRDILQYWPALIIVAGVLKLIDGYRR